jgi:hypothetical protein
MYVLRSWAALILASFILASFVVGCGSGVVQSGEGGSSGTGAGGGAAQACNACVDALGLGTSGTPCNGASQACAADATCAEWLGCTNACYEHDFTEGCLSACDAAAASVKGLTDPVYACVCAGCASECSVACM